MTTSLTPGPNSDPAPLRPGRKLGPITITAGSAHRAWLEPTRERYLASGRTLSDLSLSVPLAKSKLSELLRGLGHYPRWEVIHRLAEELCIPGWPLHRLWKQAALDAGKTRDWVDRSTEGTVTIARFGPPLEHDALRLMAAEGYRRYAAAFLPDDARDAAVEDTFAILWLSFDNALASPDTRRYAWNVLRATVKAKADHRDHRPVLEKAAFDTVALREQTSPEGEMTQLAESMELFAAISRLPDTQLDVMVLRRLCGFTTEKVSDLLGIPLAAVRVRRTPRRTLPGRHHRDHRVAARDRRNHLMTTLEDILSRALLVRDRAVPRDTIPLRDTDQTSQPVTPAHAPTSSQTAAEDLRALCETLVRHTPATAVSAFVTDQVPEPRSALVLACVLQLTDTDDGARFWWQYAAGAGQPGAAYCLYLHHLALGETHTARWWHTQTNEDKPPAYRTRTTVQWDNNPVVLHHEDKASTGTIVRVLRHLARHVSQPRSAVLTELMNYMPTAVAIGYLREPDSELPLPGPAFAHKIRALLDMVADQPDSPSDLPARPQTGHTQRPDADRPAAPRHVDEPVTR